MLKRFLFISLFNILLFANQLSLFAATGKESTKECSICHYEWLDVFMHQMRSTEIAKLPQKRYVADERMCFSCHDGSVVDSRIKVWSNDMHKVGVKVPSTMSVPNELPLSADNKIECRTCHTAHGTGDPKKEGMERSVFLRIPNENGELCKLCHKDKVGYSNHPEKVVKEHLRNELMVLGKKHNVMCMSCHTPHGSKNYKILVDPLIESKICGDCHIDKIKNGEYVKGLLNHPINVKLKDDMVEEVERNKISANSGKIGCNTCHKPHKAVDNNLLVMTNKNDELCFVCHYEKRQVYYSNHNLFKKQTLDSSIFDNSPSSVCNVCHKPHGWNVKYSTNDKDPYSVLCLSCHSNPTLVKDKIIDLKSKFNHPIMKLIDFKIELPLYDNINNAVTTSSKRYQYGYVTCFSCHDTHSKSKGFLRKELTNNLLCLECHKDKKSILNSKHFSKDISCISCHKIHNADSPNLIIGLDDNCMQCHNKDGIAKTKMIGENSHPVNRVPKFKIKKEYKLKDGKIVCVTCHNPHDKGYDGKFLRKNKLGLCTDCHDDKKEINNTKHDFTLKNRDNDFCRECHSVHNAKSREKIFSFETKNKKDLCITCHNRDGMVKKIPPQMIHPDKNFKTITTMFKGETIECVDCHDPHKNGPRVNDKNNFRYSFLKHNSEKIVCFNCHNDKLNLISSKHNILSSKQDYSIFGITKDEGDPCGFCHPIHNYKNIAIKGLKNRYICENCHRNKDIVDKKTIYTSHRFINVENYKLKTKKNNNMTCSTCHDPHETSKNMLVQKRKSNELCTECHVEQSYIFYSPHNSDVSSKDKFVCGDCHLPHNYPKNNKYMWKQTKDVADFIEGVCFECHSSSGSAKNKVITFYTHPDLPMTYKIDKSIKPFLYNSLGEKTYVGKITCSTCHDSHVWSEKENMRKNLEKKEGDALTSFLKYKNILEFCNTCHGQEGLLRYKYYHTNKYRKTVSKDITKRVEKGIDLREKFIKILLGDGELME